MLWVFCFKQKTAYEMRISDWSSDVCSSDLEFMVAEDGLALHYLEQPTYGIAESYARREVNCLSFTMMFIALARAAGVDAYAQMSGDTLAMRLVDDTLMRAKHVKAGIDANRQQYTVDRSEEHTSELHSLMRTSYAVFCLTKKH